MNPSSSLPLEAMSSSSTTESAHTTSSTTSSKGVGAGAGAKAKSARQKRDQRRLDAVAEQIKDHIAAGRFYEAEQCHKSLYNRFVNTIDSLRCLAFGARGASRRVDKLRRF